MNNLVIPINNLVYNPLRLVTHSKTFSDGFNIQNSFTFDYKEPNARDSDNYSIADFAFWIGNYFEVYDRNYKKLQNVLADLGGIIKLVILCAEIINHPYNNYVILKNTINFLCEQTKNEKKIISTTINKRNNNIFASIITQKDLKFQANSDLKNNYLNIQDINSKKKFLVLILVFIK